MADRDDFLDRMKIRETAELYFFHCDAHEPEKVALCFARDAVFRSATQSEMMLRGREQLEQGFRGFTTYGRGCHTITSMAIEVDGDTATSRLFGTSILAGAANIGDPVFVRGLRYSDRWVIEDGRWVITERVHEALWQFESTLIHNMLPKEPALPPEALR